MEALTLMGAVGGGVVAALLMTRLGIGAVIALMPARE